MSPIDHLDVDTSHHIQKLKMQGQDMQNQMYQIKATESPKKPCEEEQTLITLLLLPLYTDVAVYVPQVHNVKFPGKQKKAVSPKALYQSHTVIMGSFPLRAITILTIQGIVRNRTI